MFDVGFTEILLIGIVALVVIGPERLPAVAKTAGQWIGKLQRFVRGVKTDLASELQSGDLKKLIGDQREQINELKNMVSSAKRDFENNTRDVVQGAKKSLGEMETSVREIDGIAGDKGKSTTAQTSTTVPLESDSVLLSKPSQSSTSADDGSAATADTSAGSSHIEKAEAADASAVSRSAKSDPSNTTGVSETPPMRTDSPASSDDSAEMNRTGTESGS